jgi:Cupin domain
MYHWEADQEDFFVLAGEALLLVEGEERPLREWDFVHCPPGTDHIIIGAGDAPAVTTTRSAAPSTYHAMPRTPDCSIAWRAVESWPFADVACGRGGGGGTGFTPKSPPGRWRRRATGRLLCPLGPRLRGSCSSLAPTRTAAARSRRQRPARQNLRVWESGLRFQRLGNLGLGQVEQPRRCQCRAETALGSARQRDDRAAHRVALASLRRSRPGALPRPASSPQAESVGLLLPRPTRSRAPVVRQ